MSARWPVRILAAALLALVALLPSGAWAESGLGLSADGQHWADTLREPLFDPAVLWVPGDALGASFYVRNQSHRHTRLQVWLSDPAPSTALSRSMDLEVRFPRGAWTALTPQVGDHASYGVVLPSRASTRVQVRVAFAPAADNATQDATTGLHLVATLVDARATNGSTTITPAPVAGELPNTGTMLSGEMLLGAVLLIFLGALLVAVGRRRRDPEEVPPRAHR